jgi:hypothetical protein
VACKELEFVLTLASNKYWCPHKLGRYSHSLNIVLAYQDTPSHKLGRYSHSLL